MNYKNNKINKIEPLQIGDGKEKPKFSLDLKFKNLKDWFIGVIIRW